MSTGAAITADSLCGSSSDAAETPLLLERYKLPFFLPKSVIQLDSCRIHWPGTAVTADTKTPDCMWPPAEVAPDKPVEAIRNVVLVV